MNLTTLLNYIPNAHFVDIFDASGLLLYAGIALYVPEDLCDEEVDLIKATDSETLEIYMEDEL